MRTFHIRDAGQLVIPKANAHLTTLGFHRLALFVWGSVVPKEVGDPSLLHPTEVVRLWPHPRSEHWPPHRVIDDENVDLLSEGPFRWDP